MSSLDPEFAKLWSDALRSGKYHQTYFSLRRRREAGGFAYCPLGVLADLYDPSKWGNGVEQTLYDGSRTLLPEEVRQAVGLSLQDQDMLANANDLGASFNEIADIVDELPTRKAKS